MNDYGLQVLQASLHVLDGVLDGLAQQPVAVGASLLALAAVGARLIVAPAAGPFAGAPATPDAPFVGGDRPLAGNEAAARAVAAADAPAGRGLLAVHTPGGGE